MVAKPLTKCPECSSKITNRFECRNCGLLFDRYFKAQARKRKEEKERAAQKAKTMQIVSGTIIIIAVITIGAVTWYFSSAKKQDQVSIAPTLQTEQPEPAQVVQQTAATENDSVTTQPDQPAKPTSNSIKIVLNATAVIETPWGQGTGFFIAEDKLVTNKHIAQYDLTRLENELQLFKENESLLIEEAAKLETLKQRTKTITDKQEKLKHETTIKNRTDRLEKKRAKNQQFGQQLTKIQQEIETPDIFIMLADGRKMHMAYMEISSNYDLALLTILSAGINPVKTADASLNLGDLVYSLGKNTTSFNGTFTGYNEMGFITTDKPISPSYSGGPLIDKDGKVHAISILPPRDQNTIGLAIPIATVQQEFGL